MSLLIDGYNLMHATGIVGRGGPGGFERARQGLLNFLVASIEASELRRTVVVFDAVHAPPGLPRTIDFGGLIVRYATGDEGADALIEALIREESAPARLTVVSSDHRLHRAARRRKATPIDSDKWYAQAVERRRRRQSEPPTSTAPLTVPEDEVEYWLREFDVPHQKTSEPTTQDAFNPFPPGYAEDVLDEDRT